MPERGRHRPRRVSFFRWGSRDNEGWADRSRVSITNAGDDFPPQPVLPHPRAFAAANRHPSIPTRISVLLLYGGSFMVQKEPLAHCAWVSPSGKRVCDCGPGNEGSGRGCERRFAWVDSGEWTLLSASDGRGLEQPTLDGDLGQAFTKQHFSRSQSQEEQSNFGQIGTGEER